MLKNGVIRKCIKHIYAKVGKALLFCYPDDDVPQKSKLQNCAIIGDEVQTVHVWSQYEYTLLVSLSKRKLIQENHYEPIHPLHTLSSAV